MALSRAGRARPVSLAKAAAVFLASLGVLGASPAALADDYDVEVVELLTKERAEGLAASIDLDSGEARVYRRFISGEGWGHGLVLDGVATTDEVSHWTAHFEAEGVAVKVRGLETATATVDTSAAESTATTPVVVPAVRERDRRAEALLKLAIKAHGAPDGGGAVLAAAPVVHFEFRRTLHLDTGPLVVRHSYTRAGIARRLEVTVEQGEGTDSLTVVTTANQAWLREESAVTARRADRAVEVIDRFSPESVLGAVLDLSHRMKVAPEWEGLALVEADGEICLEAEDGADELQRACFGPDTGLVNRLVWASAGGPVTWELGEPRAWLEDWMLPSRLSIHNPVGPIEEVELLALNLPERATAGSFDQPVVDGL